MISVGFPPVSSQAAHTLILGTLPGAESLRLQQYYGKPHNRFWWIMGELFGALPHLPYERRLAILRQAGLALWDVCAAAERPGSLDASIRAHSVVPNDIGALLGAHPHIELICFNGGGAQKLFNARVLPGLPPRQAALARRLLPSTSPAYAAMRPQEKLARRKAVLMPG